MRRFVLGKDFDFVLENFKIYQSVENCRKLCKLGIRIELIVLMRFIVLSTALLLQGASNFTRGRIYFMEPNRLLLNIFILFISRRKSTRKMET